MPDVFISYSRRDGEFVRRLHDALVHAGRETWVDWLGVAPTAEFMREIRGAIEAASNFIFILSPDSVRSEACHLELTYAIACNKRLVPLACRDVAATDVPAELRPLNWLFMRRQDDFGATSQRLLEALETDLEWARAHARLLVRAVEWEHQNRNPSFLLRGADLQQAISWLAQPRVNPAPTELQRQYVNEGEIQENADLEKLNRILEEAREQRAIAESERRNAQEQLAVSLLSQGDAYGQLHRWPEARALYRKGREALAQLEKPTTTADLGLWNAARLAPLPLHDVRVRDSRILEAVFANEPNLILAASEDGVVTFWDYIEGCDRHPHLSLNRQLGDVWIYPALDIIIAANKDRVRIERWSISRRAMTDAFDAPFVVTAAAISASGNCLALAGMDGRLALYASPDPQPTWVVQAHSSMIKAVSISRCERYVVTGALGLNMKGRSMNLAGGVVEPTLRLWDRRTGAFVHPFDDNQLMIDELQFSPDGTTLVATGKQFQTLNAEICIYEFKSGSLKRVIKKGMYDEGGVVVSPDGANIVSTGGATTVLRNWSADTATVERVFDGAGREIDVKSISADRRFILGVGDDDRLIVWPFDTQNELRRLKTDIGCVRTIAFSEDGRFAAIGGAVSVNLAMGSPVLVAAIGQGRMHVAVEVWDVETRTRLLRRFPHKSNVSALSFSPDNRFLYSAGTDYRFVIWSLETGAQVRSFDLHNRWATSISVRSDGASAFLGLSNGEIELWDLASGTIQGAIKAHSDLIRDARLIDQGSQIVSIGDDDYLRLWDSASGAATGEIKVESGMAGFAVDGRGKLLATAGSGGLDIWRLDSLEHVRRLSAGSGRIMKLAFTPDAVAVAGTASDGRLSLWDAESGRELLNLTGHEGIVYGLALAPDGQQLIVGGDDGIVELFDFSLPAQQERLRGRLEESAYAASPSNAAALAASGELLFHRGVPDGSLTLLRQAHEADPNLVSPTLLAQARLATGDLPGAQASFADAESRVGSEDASYVRVAARLLSPAVQNAPERPAEDEEASCPRCGGPLSQQDLKDRYCSRCGVNVDEFVLGSSVALLEPILKMEGVAYQTVQGSSDGSDAAGEREVRSERATPAAAQSKPPQQSGIPGRPLIYVFQHIALRDAVFQNHPELMRHLAQPNEFMPLLHFRSKASMICDQQGWRDLDPDSDGGEDVEETLLGQIETHRFNQRGFTLFVVTMPPPEFAGESYMVAIVHRDSEPHEYMKSSPSTRYFTLEKTRRSPTPLLCEWYADGTRKNYGEGPHQSVEEFADAVFARLT
jgi:WD40 repeat protein